MFKTLFKKKNPTVLPEDIPQNVPHPPAPVVVPKGWFVYEAGQSPLHMLWYVNIVNFADLSANLEVIRNYYSEEKDSFNEALTDAVNQITND